jgi:hypothetical protein
MSDISLDDLKTLADEMGLKYHPAIGRDKLIAKIEEARSENAIADAVAEVVPEKPEVKKETPGQKRQRLQKEAAKLVRLRVTNMNPNKKEWEGEIFTVSNSVVGTFKKYVPFGVEWHVPHIIYEAIVARQCQVFTTVNGPRGNKMRKGKMIKEFSIEVLPPLTEAEIKDLAQQQAMSGAIDQE